MTVRILSVERPRLCLLAAGMALAIVSAGPAGAQNANDVIRSLAPTAAPPTGIPSEPTQMPSQPPMGAPGGAAPPQTPGTQPAPTRLSGPTQNNTAAPPTAATPTTPPRANRRLSARRAPIRRPANQ
jgi:hypothetical protein